MKRWIYKLEYKYGNFCIRDLTLVLVGGQILVYLIAMISDIDLLQRLSLNLYRVSAGEIWRLITFVFVPSSFQPLNFILGAYFFYLVGHTLEVNWGDFRFNLYYLLGMLGAIAAAFLSNGFGSSWYLNQSLFLAFAVLCPDVQVLLFFIIPIKMKYLALFSGVLYVIQFLFGTMSSRLAILFALVNFLLFFGGDFMAFVRREIMYARNRRNWRNGGGRW